MRFVPSPEQAAVIRAPLAPLRVSAGAGTGKTATLAARVAALVEGGIEPEEVLGVTFTNKAADELAERIRLALGKALDPTRQIEVHTYHGFAADLLREYGALVGVERGVQIVTPAYARQILAQVVRSVPSRAFDPTVPAALEALRRLASALADNLLTPDDVVLPEELDEVWARRAEMLAMLRRYEAEKLRIGVADYGDLIRKAHQLVRDHPSVAEAVAGRYRAVLLDEYQDTDPAQRELLRSLFSGRVPVMAVGDEDQTIYEWRGASLQNFRRFPVHFPHRGEPAATLPLTRNRRSGPAILELANRIRRQIDPEHRPDLVPLAEAPEGKVTTGWFGTAAAEAEWIARRVLVLHEEGRAWRDVAVLFRKNRHMLLVHDALARHDVPFEVANLGGLLSVPEVTDLHAWLRLIARPDDGPALARLLLGSRFRLGLGDLAALARWVRSRRGASDLDLEHDSALPDFTLVEAIDHLEELGELRPGAVEALSRFRSEHHRLLVGAQGLSLVDLCRTVLDVTGAWGDVSAMDQAAGLSARLNLYRFLDLAEGWSPLEGHPSLDAFLTHLDAMAEDSAEELDTARISDSDAVTLITVHRAKGLEWPVVFLPTAYHGNFPSHGSLDNPLVSPEVLPFELRLDSDDLPSLDVSSPKRDQDALLRSRRDGQEWRIAYVAATRAREELSVTGASWYGHPQPTQRPSTPSELFELADSVPTTERVAAITEPPPRPDALGIRSQASGPPDPHFEGSWPAALRAAVADPGWPRMEARERGIVRAYDEAVAELQQMLFRLPEPQPPEEETGVQTSATGLVTYAVCPLRFFWSEVDRLPRRTSRAARRGVDVHRRIELHHLGVVPLEDASPETYDLGEGDLGEDHLQAPERDGTGGGADPYRRFLDSRFARSRPLLVEAPFELRLTPTTRVRGRMDAVYGDDRGGWEVVDFKTGRRRQDDALLVQLQTYAVAASEISFGFDPPERLSVTFAFLGGGSPEEWTHRVDERWLTRARRRLAELTAGIEGARWDATPSDACRGCDFLRFCREGRRHLA